MKLELDLFVREHRNGCFTLSVIGEPSLTAYATSLEAGRQDLALVISDRVERTHPSLQSALSARRAERLESLELDAILPVFDGGEEQRLPLRLSVLASEARSFVGLWAPRPDLHVWTPKKGAAWDVVTRELLLAHLPRMSRTALLALRFERREWIETLVVEAEPPPLSAFSGKLEGATMLPPRSADAGSEADDEREDDDPPVDPEDDTPPPAKGARSKKRRPETPTLRRIGVPMSRLARDGELEHAHERSQELMELLRTLEAPGEKPIVVVGPSGVGKTALLSELVYRLASPDAPPRLRRRSIWFADASRLIAGDGLFGDWQGQCLDVIAECERAEVIWYIGALLPLLDAGKHISSDHNVALLLQPYLAARRLTIIAESTEKDLTTVELRNAAFARAFTPIRISEPQPEESRRILGQVARELDRTEGVTLTRGGEEAIFELTRRYVSDGSHLGAALHFLRRTVEKLSAQRAQTLDRVGVVRAFAAETGLPELLIRDDLPLSLAPVEPAASADQGGAGSVVAGFAHRLIGQEQAVQRMIDLISVIKAGLSDLSRPLGSFLFVGPTGVGKTETAKALAAFLFGGEHRLTRFDMSEYVGHDAIHRFLGDARSEGKLVEAVRRRPFSVVLLDEIEKAHPAIFDVLLGVLGEARLTDEAGRTADFKNTVIIMTSNLGADTAKSRAGFDPKASLTEHYLRETERFFRPELFNRIDHIVAFSPLEAPAILQIAGRELEKLGRREGLRQRGISLELTPEAMDWLARRGTDPRYGARPLKRVIEREVAIPLARHLSETSEDAGLLELTVEARSREPSPDPSPGGPAGWPEGPGPREGPGEGEHLALHLRRPRAGAGRGQDPRAGLRRLLDRARDTVFRIARWKLSAPFRELVQDLRLLDQLSANRQFWANRVLAEERTAGMAGARALLDRHGALERRAGELEDVALEGWHARDTSGLAMMEEELSAIRAELPELELGIFERRFQEPSSAVLYLVPARGSSTFPGKLIELYANLAYELGWRVTRFGARPVAGSDGGAAPKVPRAPGEGASASKAPPKTARERKKVARQKEDAAVIRIAPKDPDAAEAPVQWHRVGAMDPARDPQMDGAGGDNARRARILAGIYDEANGRAAALAFEGEHVAALLSGEHGLHHQISGTDNETVQVVFVNTPPGVSLLHPRDLARVDERRRTIQHNKHLLEDHGLDLHLPLEPRLHHLYRRLMGARIYREVFGEAGAAYFRAFGLAERSEPREARDASGTTGGESSERALDAGTAAAGREEGVG